ncbi:MAG: helix-turn-helix transcriptional regulator [Deltaproteobacteria bacterium]|nr:helix-turn-helix transcriptional regulator [Deltaproteobacteria bacterium]
MKLQSSAQNYDQGLLEVQNLKTIGRVLRKKRQQMGMTQAEAAGLCNVGIRFMSELENGKPTMHFDKALKVLKSFGLIIYMRERS